MEGKRAYLFTWRRRLIAMPPPDLPPAPHHRRNAMAYSLSRERPLAAAWPVAFVARLARLVGEAAKARRQRVALAALLEMDEYRLWDLGVTRQDLQRALRAEEFDIEAIRDRRRGLDIWPPA
jgi:uncharacterized protein YjiS (DUF1127 family)